MMARRKRYKLDAETVAGRMAWLLRTLWFGSQTAMAEALHLHPASISNVMRGKRVPGRNIVAAVASHPLVNEKWLLHGVGRPLAVESVSGPQWINGPPTDTGLWITERSGEYYAWRVELDVYEGDAGGFGSLYLRFSDGETSEPIEGYPWPPERSFGPCPLANGSSTIYSVRVAGLIVEEANLYSMQSLRSMVSPNIPQAPLGGTGRKMKEPV